MRSIGLFVFAMLAMAFVAQGADARLFQRLRDRRQSHGGIVRNTLGGGCANGSCSR